MKQILLHKCFPAERRIASLHGNTHPHAIWLLFLQSSAFLNDSHSFGSYTSSAGNLFSSKSPKITPSPANPPLEIAGRHQKPGPAISLPIRSHQLRSVQFWLSQYLETPATLYGQQLSPFGFGLSVHRARGRDARQSRKRPAQPASCTPSSPD